MKHNFSRELACFNLAQEILEKLVEVEEDNDYVSTLEIDFRKIDATAIKFIGRELSQNEMKAIAESLIIIGPSIKKDCSTFEFAHHLYHIIVD